MRIALFGGTFDPVHSGHLTAACASQAAFGLDQVHFVPASAPPHKRGRPLTQFVHRYAMVTLACAGHPWFLPSLMESGENEGPNYSIDTVSRLLSQLTEDDRLYFLIGADAFLEIRQWREPATLLDMVDFIVVSRPGFSISHAAQAIPQELHAGAMTEHAIQLRRTQVHLLPTVNADISSSAIRRRAAAGEKLDGLVPEVVGEYIRKFALYQDEEQTG